MHRLFSEALNAGDLAGLVAQYEPGATLVPQPGQAVTGSAAIREALAGFLAMRPHITLTTRKIVQAADVALLYSRWVLRGTGPDGKPVQM
jgi:ketosteroid isomerase-like protein